MKVKWSGIEPVTFQLRVRHPNHATPSVLHSTDLVPNTIPIFMERNAILLQCFDTVSCLYTIQLQRSPKTYFLGEMDLTPVSTENRPVTQKAVHTYYQTLTCYTEQFAVNRHKVEQNRTWELLQHSESTHYPT